MDNIIKINTISEFHQLIGFEKAKHPLITIIDYAKMKADYPQGPFKVVDSFYSISLKDNCVGEMQYGRNKYDFQEGSLLCKGPEQAITIDVGEEPLDANGWGLYFHPDLIRRSTLGKTIKDYSFFSYESNEALHLSDNEKETLEEILDKIRLELKQNIDKHSQTLIISNIELLLNYCNRYYDRQFITRENHNKDLISKFEELLADYFTSDKVVNRGLPSVKYCAEQMGFSPNYLSDLLKKDTGKNTQEHIHYYLIEEAKNRLLNSNITVSEIAYNLGFEYPQHFSKIFKKKTGVTPASYRNVN
ncbi:helix-turn-helix domain-containing protein [Labilibacter marinus]|uniref:helix-turn-helix domain-containing protein n=1 Tax=Labilibacter marinus TaxID=1477105 RepID=UPI00094F78F3|nr:response regulator transcription factor [Labilibacter marinus]